MEVVRSKQALTEAIRCLRGVGKTVGLVPTMGALHAGHVSLMDIARKKAKLVVASIFVNPTQFGPNEDFNRYPRPEDEDLFALKKAKVNVAYLPTVEEMYPQGFSTTVSAGPIASELCGAFRPGHFDGVATVVTKLLLQVQPDVAVFGEKDYQQLHVIRHVVRDLDVGVQIMGGPTLREEDGLAMSSRNRYLNVRERAVAPMLHRTLETAAANLRKGQGVAAMLAQVKAVLLSTGFTKVDYVELRDAATLAPVVDLAKPARLLAAAYLGTTRLIDNIEVLP